MFGTPPSPAPSTVSFRSGTYEHHPQDQDLPFWTDSLNQETSGRLVIDTNSEDQGLNINNVHQNVHVEDEDHTFSSHAGEDDVILCIFNRGEKLGAAFYDVEDATLHVINDRIDPNYRQKSFQFLESLVRQINPAHLIVSASQGKDVLTTVRQLCGLNPSEEDTSEKENVKPQVN